MAVLKIRVRCPHCGKTFATNTIKTVKCRWCNKSFKVFYKKRWLGKWCWKSRIVKIEKGSKKLLFDMFENLKREKLLKTKL